MGPLRLSSHALATLQAHAAAERPRECCGILVGAGSPPAVDEVVAVTNRHPHPRGGYTIAAADLAATLRAARQRRRRVLGFYHSHPQSPARPSEADRAAAWDGMSYCIVGECAERSEVRSWRRGAAGEMVEQPVEVA
ncbi:MAG TPA: M67 family metallopeptidase [Thermoanaerobaculia bacterium]|nr:M67 family metallopeptidase [Thermoanaerobaculia bacterium]